MDEQLIMFIRVTYGGDKESSNRTYGMNGTYNNNEVNIEFIRYFN